MNHLACRLVHPKSLTAFTINKGCDTVLSVRFWFPHSSNRGRKYETNTLSSCLIPGKVLVHSSSRQNGDLQARIATFQDASYMKYLYILYFMACLMERTWRFALPVVLSNIAGGGYQAVAILCFMSPLACFLFAPVVGRILDKVNRVAGVWSLLSLQCSSIIFSGCLLIHALQNSLCITSGPLFNLILALQMVEKLAAVTSEVAIERDWLTKVCGKENTSVLAHGNSMLRRMDLACDFLGTVTYGWMFDFVGPIGATIYTTSIAICSAPVLYALIFLKLEDGLRSNSHRDGTTQMGSGGKFSITFNAWKQYFFNNSMLPSSIVVVLLYFNVALSPGGILTSFLTVKGMNGTSLAIFRGACALMGFVGSYWGKILIEQYGLLVSGRYALASLVVSLGSSVLIFLFGLNSWNSDSQTSSHLIVFAVGIVLSRIGLWTFDMVNTQLFQQYADGSQPSATASTEMALCSLSEIFMLGVAAFLSIPMDTFFCLLVGSSYGAIVLGAMIFHTWSKNKEKDPDFPLPNAVA